MQKQHGKFGKMNNLIKTYKGKKVLITGHTGFKGSWLLKTLSLFGAELTGYSLAPKTNDDLYNLINGENLCNSIIDDILNKENLEKTILDFEPDYIFHLAAQPLVIESYVNPSDTFLINSIGTAYLLDAVRKLKNKCNVILITTDKVYQNNEWQYPYREIDRLGGKDPYSASKACTELLISSYRHSYFNVKDSSVHKKSICVARAGNVIGGGDWSSNRLIPDIIRSLTNSKEILIRNPNSIRPWQHVLEPLNGYLILGMKAEQNQIKYSDSFNFGPNPEDVLSVEELVKLSIANWGFGRYQIENAENYFHEAGILKLDISKSISNLNWKPLLTSKESLDMTLKWYKIYNSNKEEVQDFTNEQIMNFFKF
jgi:CDP-glucose 4,6-dehydratase